jgi:hypothetical protein
MPGAAQRIENYQPLVLEAGPFFENNQQSMAAAPRRHELELLGTAVVSEPLLRGRYLRGGSEPASQVQLSAPHVPDVFANMITVFFYLGSKFLRLAPNAANSAGAPVTAKAALLSNGARPLPLSLKMSEAVTGVQGVGMLASMGHVKRRLFEAD